MIHDASKRLYVHYGNLTAYNMAFLRFYLKVDQGHCAELRRGTIRVFRQFENNFNVILVDLFFL